jgi:hypothetical protein
MPNMYLQGLSPAADVYLRGLAAAAGLPIVRVVEALAAKAEADGWTLTGPVIVIRPEVTGDVGA